MCQDESAARSSSAAASPSAFAPADNPAVLAHMNMLQGIINRLAGNSSSCKTWCLTLVASLLGLSGATHQPDIVTATLVPIAVFGFMDLMYLAQESAYRDLFNGLACKVRDGTYDLADAFYAKAPIRFGPNICKALRSWAIVPIYGGLLTAYGIARWQGWLALWLSTAPAKPA